MYLRNVIFAALLLFTPMAFAATEIDTQNSASLGGIEWSHVEKMLGKHFSIADIEGLKEYMKGAMMGLQVPMAPDLKDKVRKFMTDMRLEYGFQFAVMIAELKKKVFRVLPPDLAELAEEFSKKSPADSDE